MKYKMFRNLLLVGAALSLGGGVLYLGKRGSSPATTSPAAALPAAASQPAAAAGALPAPPPPASPPAAEPPARTARGEGMSLREVDRELLRLYSEIRSRPPAAKGGAPKVKDVFPDRPYKINLYEEDGRLARAKIDLNRNGKWDEKWTFAPGRGDLGDPVVKRQVSPADDDTTYPLTYKLVDKVWVAESDPK